MKKIALVIALIFATTSAMAAPQVYVRSNGQFVGNENEYPRGFWIPSVNGAEEVFSANPQALDAYKAHVRDAQWFGILNWGALGLFLTYAVASGSRFDGAAGAIIFFVPWGIGVYKGAQSNRHLLKAINLINGVPFEQARGRGLSAPRVNLFAWDF